MKIVHHFANGCFDWLISEDKRLILGEKDFLYCLGNTKDLHLPIRDSFVLGQFANASKDPSVPGQLFGTSFVIFDDIKHRLEQILRTDIPLSEL